MQGRLDASKEWAANNNAGSTSGLGGNRGLKEGERDPVPALLPLSHHPLLTLLALTTLCREHDPFSSSYYSPA